MRLAYLGPSGSKRVPRWPTVPLVALIALLLVFSPAAAFGAGAPRSEAASLRSVEGSAQALLGDSKVEARRVALAGGKVEAFRVHAHASGRAATLLVFVDARSSAAQLVVGLYRNAHGHPGRLLATGSVERPTAGAWNAARLVRAPRLVAGRSYWLTLLGEGGALRYRARLGGRCLGARSLKAHLGALPDAWRAGRVVRHAHCPISAYAVAASFSSPTPFGAAPNSPVAGGAPVNLTPPTIAAQGPTGSGLPQAFLPFLPPSEQVPVEEKPGETPKEKTTEKPGEEGSKEKGKEENPGKEKPSEEPSEEPTKEKPVEKEKPKEAMPHNSVVPAIGGTLVAGDILSATKGTWSGSPTSFAYQWQDCDTTGKNCANTSGATAATYTLQSSDVGHTMTVVVTATNAGGSTSATSAATGVVAAYSSGQPYPTCTQTISVGANVASTVSGAAAGSVICLKSGAYGNPTLNASHSSDVTVQAAPEAHVTTGAVMLEGDHIVVRGLWIDGEVALQEGASYMTIDRDDITGGGEGIVFDTSDCTVPNAPTWTGCEPHKPISNVVISANHIHNIGENGTEDAIHLDNWRNVTVTGNEFDHINESGNHTDCLESVYGGKGSCSTTTMSTTTTVKASSSRTGTPPMCPSPTTCFARPGRLLRQLRTGVEREGPHDPAQHDLGRQGLRARGQRRFVYADGHDRPQRDQHLQSRKTDRQRFLDHRGR